MDHDLFAHFMRTFLQDEAEERPSSSLTGEHGAPDEEERFRRPLFAGIGSKNRERPRNSESHSGIAFKSKSEPNPKPLSSRSSASKPTVDLFSLSMLD